MDRHRLVKCQGFVDPRFWAQVPAGEQTSAQGPGDQDRVAGAGAGATHGAARGRFPQEGDTDHQGPVPGVGVAADYIDAEAVSELAHARIDLLCKDGAMTRGRATATTAARGIPAMAAMSDRFTPRALKPTARAVVTQAEMAIIHQHVSRHEQVCAGPGPQDRAIVADAQLGPQA